MAWELNVAPDELPEAPAPAPPSGSMVGDVAATIGSGVVGQTGDLLGGINDLAGVPQNDRPVQDLFNAAKDVIDAAVSPAGKAVAHADITTPEGRQTMLRNPGRTLAMKGAEVAPSLLQAMALPTGWAGVAIGSGFFSAQGVSAQLNAVHKKIEGMTDAELQAKVPLYRAIREDNDETSSRQQLYDAQNDTSSLLMTGGANALAGGVLGHIVKGPAAKSFLRSMGVGAAEVGLGLGVVGAGSEAGKQQGEINTGERQEFDPHEMAVAGLNSAATGVLLGGATGAYRGIGLPRKVRPTAKEKDIETGRTVPNGEPDPAQAAALAASKEPADKTGSQPSSGEGTLAEQIAAEEAKARVPGTGAEVTPPTSDLSQAPKVPMAPAAGAAAPQLAVGKVSEPPIPLPTVDVPKAVSPESVVHPEQPVPVVPAAPVVEPPLPIPPAAPPKVEAPVTAAEAEGIVAGLPKKAEPKKKPAPLPVKEEKPAAGVPDAVTVAPHDALNKAVADAQVPLAGLSAAELRAMSDRLGDKFMPVYNAMKAAYEAGNTAEGRRLSKLLDTMERVHDKIDTAAEDAEEATASNAKPVEVTPPAKPAVKKEPIADHYLGDTIAGDRVYERSDGSRYAVTDQTTTTSDGTKHNVIYESSVHGLDSDRLKVAEKEPLAALVDTTKEGKKVFRVEKSEALKKVEAVRDEKIEKEKARVAEVERKREERFNKQGENEAKAKEAITASHPTDAEELQGRHAAEQQALGTGEGAESARADLKLRAANTLATAENAGVRIVERTRPTAEQREAGEKNPTPYTSRLSELKKFFMREKIARQIQDPAKREKALQELYTEHVSAERAIRAEDFDVAAERRLAANEARDARHRAGRVKEEVQRTAEEQAELDKLVGEQEDERSENRASKTEHYDLKPGQKVRHSTVRHELEQLAREFDPANFKIPALKARAVLLGQIFRRIIERVGDTPMHFVGDAAMKADLELGPNMSAGFFHFLGKGATTEGIRGDIYINNDIAYTTHGPITILHEAVHALTNHAIAHDPRLNEDLRLVRQEAYDTASAELKKEYAFDPDIREFLAEAIANPTIRGHLQKTPASPALVRMLGLEGPRHSLWRAMVGAITRALGLGEKHVTLMDAVLNLFERGAEFEPASGDGSLRDLRHLHADTRNATSDVTHRWINGDRTARDLQQKIEDAPHISAAVQSRLRALGLKLGTTHQVAQMAEKYLPGAMQLWTLAKKMAHGKELILDSSGARNLVARVAQLERRTTPERMAEFGDFLRDETMAEVFVDQPLANQKGVTSQGKAQYADLAKRYDRLSDEEKDLRADLHDYFKAQQEAAGLATLKAIIRAVNPKGEPDDALAQKIFDKKLTDAEKKVLDSHHVMRAVRNARALSKIKGPYVPLTRHGEHVVSGSYDVPVPAGGMRLNEEGVPDAKGTVYQFDTKAQADAFAAGSPVKVTREQKVYTDPTTGERHAVDPATGEKTRLTKEDWAANQADEKFRVTLQPKHLEFFEIETEARRRHEELAAHDWAKEGVGFALDGVAPRRWEPTGRNATFISHEFDRALNSLRQRGGFQSLDANARRELENHLAELSLSSLGSTRAQSRRLPRTFVKGASGDIQKGLTQYASSMSGFLARQKYMPEIDQLMKQMVAYQDAHQYEDSSKTYPRGQVLKELQERLFRAGEPERRSMTDTVINRMLQMSQLDKLASPAFHVINSMEPWTTSLPMIGAKHGFGKALMAMHRAYADIGAPTLIGKGLKDTAMALRTSEGLTNYITTLAERVKNSQYGKELGDVIREMGELGVISKDAGMEIGRMSNPSSNVLGRGLDRADLMARQMGTAIESINRFVTAAAEYRLSREAGLDHEAARDAAVKRVVDTMGDYSQWNAPPIFNHPLGRLALQFKKFAQKTYYILGKTALGSLRGDTESMKAFAGLMATHGLLAGALGLPLEAIHAGMLAANLTGLTQDNYGDFEQGVRKTMANMFGVAGGQIASRGIPRYLGVDVSSRFSLADLVFPLGDPASSKPSDLLAYAAKAFGGAPISLIAEYPKGVQALFAGDFVEASRVLIPLKVYADSMTAYQRASVGRQTVSGREKMSPYTPGEAATRSLGFAPAREAEAMEAYSAQYGDQQRFKADRSKLTNSWVTAKPDDKATAWRSIIEWNAKQPPAAKITMAEIERMRLRRAAEAGKENMRGGLRTSKRDAHIREGASYYNDQ